MGVSGTYAVATGSSNTNVFSTGVVDIQLSEYTLNKNNEEVPYENQYTNVIPNQEISLIEKIQNDAANCYVRAKIILVNDAGQNLDLTIIGMPEDWKKIGEYYYYEPALNTGDEITIFEKIKFPQDILYSIFDKKIYKEEHKEQSAKDDNNIKHTQILAEKQNIEK